MVCAHRACGIEAVLRIEADNDQPIIDCRPQSGLGEPGRGEFQDRTAKGVTGVIGKHNKRWLSGDSVAERQAVAVFIAERQIGRQRRIGRRRRRNCRELGRAEICVRRRGGESHRHQQRTNLIRAVLMVLPWRRRRSHFVRRRSAMTAPAAAAGVAHRRRRPSAPKAAWRDRSGFALACADRRPSAKP